MSLRPPASHRRVAPPALLALAALACLCGPLGQVQSAVNKARNTAGTAQAVATEVGGAIATGQAAATEVGGAVATGQAAATAVVGFEESAATQIAPLGPTLEAALEELRPTLVASDLEVVRQWGLSATASSQRDAPAYSAAQAAGPPNTHACADAPTAWASLDPHSQSEELTVLFADAVFALQVNIYESYNPGFVTQVRLVDVFGDTPVIYQAAPQLAETCPRVLTANVPTEAASRQVSTVIITLDQSAAPSWAQIDAVELVGVR